jgi:hypothetical protein
VRGGNLFVGILDEVQMLNKEIASPRPVAEQKFDLMRGLRIYLAPLGVDLACRRPSPGCSNARTFCTSSWLIEKAHFLVPGGGTLVASMPHSKENVVFLCSGLARWTSGASRPPSEAVQ